MQSTKCGSLNAHDLLLRFLGALLEARAGMFDSGAGIRHLFLNPLHAAGLEENSKVR
jgi:hypothetical protein